MPTGWHFRCGGRIVIILSPTLGADPLLRPPVVIKLMAMRLVPLGGEEVDDLFHPAQE